MPTVSNSKLPKKRSMTSDSNTMAKKQRVEKIVTEKSAGKKRSQPITLPVRDENDASSEEEEDEGFQEEESAVQEDSAKDPNASRESHKAQRALFDQRRAAKPHSALLSEAKQAWTLARQKNISKEERTKNIHVLMGIVRGHVMDIVFKHDASRIIQTIVKYGSSKEREEIATELKGKYQELAQNKYSKFLVTKLIRLCPGQRSFILLEFQGNIRRLLLHREASSVLADAFELYSNAYERSILLRDFYGKEASLFTVTPGSQLDKDQSKRGLKGLLDDADKDRRRRLMTAVKENLVSIFNNSDKGAVSHAIVHRVFWEYLSALNEIEDGTEREKLRREMFESCQDILAEMVHTKDGSRVVREFIAQGTAKDRKHIVKAMKPHIERMCTDDEAQLVLFTALDVIDDTKLTAKSLVADIVSAADSLYTSPQGRRSLIYLVQPRIRRHFTPAQITLLSETDSIRAQTSKKDNQVRSEEIRRAASEALLEWIAEKGPEIVRDPGGSLVVGEIMLHSEGDKKSAMNSLLKPLASRYPSPDPSVPHLISLSHASRLYKLLLQGGHYSQQTQTVERSPRFDSLEFADSFVETVGKENILAMALAEGAFIVAALCETVIWFGPKTEKSRVALKNWFDKDVKKSLQSEGEHKGRSVLLEQVAVL